MSLLSYRSSPSLFLHRAAFLIFFFTNKTRTRYCAKDNHKRQKCVKIDYERNTRRSEPHTQHRARVYPLRKAARVYSFLGLLFLLLFTDRTRCECECA